MRTLLEDVEAFLSAYPEVSQAELGRKAIGDKQLVSQLRAGRGPREKTLQAVRIWMAGFHDERTAHRGAREGSLAELDGLVVAWRAGSSLASLPAAAPRPEPAPALA